MEHRRESGTFGSKLERGERKINASPGWQHPSGEQGRWKMFPEQQDRNSAKADKSRGKRCSIIFYFFGLTLPSPDASAEFPTCLIGTSGRQRWMSSQLHSSAPGYGWQMRDAGGSSSPRSTPHAAAQPCRAAEPEAEVALRWQKSPVTFPASQHMVENEGEGGWERLKSVRDLFFTHTHPKLDTLLFYKIGILKENQAQMKNLTANVI